MWTRTAAGVLGLTAIAATAATAVVANVAAVGPGAAGAQEGDPTTMQLVGDFVGDDRDEVFTYGFGTSPDHLVQISRSGAPGSEVGISSTSFRVDGLYSPVAGDFDGDGHDEILWYAGGNRQDYLWEFTSPTTVQSRPVRIDGWDYWPVSGDFTGDGADDVFWYMPGAEQDYLWEFDAGGAYHSTARSVGGSYWPQVGSFGRDATDDILWYGQGSRPDHLWDFDAQARVTSRPYQVGGIYNPLVLDIFDDGPGGGDIIWYAPGTTADRAWDFVSGTHRSFGLSVNGDYWTVTGDFSGDGHDDVLWLNDTTVNMWDFSASGAGASSVVRWDYSFQPSSFTEGEPGGDVGAGGTRLTR